MKNKVNVGIIITIFLIIILTIGIIFIEKDEIKETKNDYKLEIINLDMTIKTQDLAYSLEDRQEFQMHIEELSQLKAIRKSTSRHRSPAFIVNNHSEQKRGKSRMIINYKRLNDNTLDNSYKIPNK